MFALMNTRAYAYLQLMRMDKPVGGCLLLWPTLWALWLAGQGQPNQVITIVFIAGVWVMRAAGCVINDMADRHVDGHVKRTQQRPLVTGMVSYRQALILFVVLLLFAGYLLRFLNTFAMILSIPAVLLAASYPFMKRYHHLPQAHLGLAFSWGIPMAYAALQNTLSLSTWLLFLANCCWVLVYDTQYAMTDREDDLRIGVKSSAILFGRYDRIIIGLLQIATLLLLAIVGKINQLGYVWQLGLAASSGFFIWQQYLMRAREARACFRAFLNNNYFGGAITIILLLSLLP